MGQVWQMHDQRVIGRPALGAENPADGGRVLRTGGQAVHGFGRQCHQLAIAQQAGRALDVCGMRF
jgi:hypothetical protein